MPPIPPRWPERRIHAEALNGFHPVTDVADRNSDRSSGRERECADDGESDLTVNQAHVAEEVRVLSLPRAHLSDGRLVAVAQLEECHVAIVEAAGSSPVCDSDAEEGDSGVRCADCRASSAPTLCCSVCRDVA